MATKTRSILTAYLDQVWNNDSRASVPEFVSPDLVAHGLNQRSVTAGIAALEAFYDDIRRQFGGIRIIVRESVAEADRESVVCTITALHLTSKKRITFTGSAVARIDGGKIAELWHYFDFMAVQEQLGPTEPVVNFQIISYNTLRRAIGFCGLLLPVLVVFGGFITNTQETVLPSISDYYFSRMGDVFVGVLCAVSFFLFCYRGHANLDNILANLAATFALCVALFPTSTDLDRNVHTGLIAYEGAAAAIHFTSAVLFFLILAFFSIQLFTRTTGEPTPQKMRRNRIYRVCGWVMIASLLLLAGFFVARHLTPDAPWVTVPQSIRIVTVLETVMLWSFGISWLTKSQAIFADEERQ